MLWTNECPIKLKKIEADGIYRTKLIDTMPVGVKVRSTVGTYANVYDDLRKIYGRTA